MPTEISTRSEPSAVVARRRMIETLVAMGGISIDQNSPIRWDRLDELNHTMKLYEVPVTACTPVMAQLLFAIGEAKRPAVIVGAGTFVGYCISWLIRRNEAESNLQSATLIDVDCVSNGIARRNCELLGHGPSLSVVDGDATVTVARTRLPIDLLYIDIDDPNAGKAGYADILEAACPLLAPGAVVVAHDPCVARFKSDFERFHRFVRDTGMFTRPHVLPVDSCGVSISVRKLYGH